MMSTTRYAQRPPESHCWLDTMHFHAGLRHIFSAKESLFKKFHQPQSLLQKLSLVPQYLLLSTGTWLASTQQQQYLPGRLATSWYTRRQRVNCVPTSYSSSRVPVVWYQVPGSYNYYILSYQQQSFQQCSVHSSLLCRRLHSAEFNFLALIGGYTFFSTEYLHTLNIHKQRTKTGQLPCHCHKWYEFFSLEKIRYDMSLFSNYRHYHKSAYSFVVRVCQSHQHRDELDGHQLLVSNQKILRGICQTTSLPGTRQTTTSAVQEFVTSQFH